MKIVKKIFSRISLPLIFKDTEKNVLQPGFTSAIKYSTIRRYGTKEFFLSLSF